VIVSRRRLMDVGLTFAAAILPAAAPPGKMVGPQLGDGFVPVREPGRPALRAAELQVGVAPVLAWPVDLKTGKVRNAPLSFSEVLVLRASAGGSTGTIVAFSAVCPHAGCTVSQWLAKTHRLRCPCHGSEFDLARGGMVLAGPAPVPLPTLPVRVVDTFVTVAGTFSAPPGGHTSRTM
jgi:rieske iron-sulfur protein